MTVGTTSPFVFDENAPSAYVAQGAESVDYRELYHKTVEELEKGIERNRRLSRKVTLQRKALRGTQKSLVSWKLKAEFWMYQYSDARKRNAVRPVPASSVKRVEKRGFWKALLAGK